MSAGDEMGVAAEGLRLVGRQHREAVEKGVGESPPRALSRRHLGHPRRESVT